MDVGAVPFPIVPPLPPREERTTYHGLEGSTLSPEQQRVLDEQRALEKQQQEQARREAEHVAKVANVEGELAKQHADEMGLQAERRAKVEAEAGRDVESWKKNLNDTYQRAMTAPAPSLFRGGATTSENITRAFGMFMMALKDAGTDSIAVQQGRAPGSHTLHDFINADLAAQRENIAQLNDRVVMARTGLKDAKDAREQMLATVDAKGAAIYKRLEALAKAQLSGMKVDKAAIDGDARVLELAQEGVKFRQQSVAGLTRKWEQPTKEIINRTPAADQKPVQPGNADVEAVNRLQSDIKTIERTIAEIEKDPKAWDEVRTNQESWERSEAAGKNPIVGTVRAIGQAIPGGLAVAPEQGLKTTRAKVINQGMAGVKTGIAKGYGGVIADYDVKNAGTEIGSLNQNAVEMVATLKKWRDNYQRSLTNYLTNRNVKVGGEVPAAPQSDAAPGPAAPPDDINSEAPLPEDPKAQSIDELQGKPASVAPTPKTAPAPAAATPAAVPADDRRTKLLDLIRRHPTDKRLRIAAKNYGITEEEIRGN